MGCCCATEKQYIKEMKTRVPSHVRHYYTEEELESRLREYYHSEWLPQSYKNNYDATWNSVVRGQLISPSKWKQNKYCYRFTHPRYHPL